MPPQLLTHLSPHPSHRTETKGLTQQSEDSSANWLTHWPPVKTWGINHCPELQSSQEWNGDCVEDRIGYLACKVFRSLHTYSSLGYLTFLLDSQEPSSVLSELCSSLGPRLLRMPAIEGREHEATRDRRQALVPHLSSRARVLPAPRDTAPVWQSLLQCKALSCPFQDWDP